MVFMLRPSSFPAKLMKTSLHLFILAALNLTLYAEEPAKIAIDTTQPGWRALTAKDFMCLESEGSPIDFRNLRIRELP